MSAKGVDADTSPPVVWRSLAIGLVLLGAVGLLGHSVDAHTWLTVDGLRAVVGGEWYAPFAYIAVIVGVMFLPAPKIVLLGLAGVLFGPWYGFLYAWVGQVLGMTALFMVARTSLRPVARRLLREHVATMHQIEGHLETRGVAVVALLRLFYFMGTPLSIMLSATRLRVSHFMTGTALGVIPAVALAVASADAAASGTTALNAAVIGIAIILVLGVGTLIRRRLRI